MKEREISLVDLIFEILLHWRSIVVAMLIGILLMGSYSYVSSYRTSKTQEAALEAAKQKLEQEVPARQEQLDNIAQVSKTWLEENLTDLQKYNVNYVLVYEELYRDKVAYLENSVLMQMDPNSVKRAEVTFLVTADDRERTYNIVKFYEDLVRSGETFEWLAKEVDVDIDVVNEILALEKESYSLQDGVDTIRVRVNHFDERVCKKMAQAIVEYMEAKTTELSDRLGSHNISVLSQSLVTVSDTNIMNQQRTYLGDIANLESSIVDYKDRFSEIEWQYYDFLINGKLTELSLSKRATAGSEIPEEPALIDIINQGVTVYPGVSMTHVILGAILAAFVCVFVIFVLYILNGKIRVTSNLQDLYMISQLGVVFKRENSTKFLGFVDDWIISLRDWNKRKFTEEEAINLISVAVKMAVEKDALHNVYLIGCGLKDQTLAFCKKLSIALVQDKVNVHILNNVLYDANAMSKLQDAQGVVLVETVGSTLYTEIAQELELLQRQDIKVLGGVIVE